MDENQYYRLLVQRFADNKCTPEEQEVFFHLLQSGKLNSFIEEDMDAYAEPTEQEAQTQPRYRRMRWVKLAAAATILILVTVGVLTQFDERKEQHNKIHSPIAHDIPAPTGNRATIQLSDGQIVYLDSVGNGALAKQGSVSINKLADGKITYQGSSSEMVYNTLSNPRGSRVIDITLADGSRVWLNAGSSLSYPVAFVGKQRQVSVTGEAYFEVASNKTMPFRVQANEMTLEVLGTHFNINSYSDEPAIQTTLLEGSVKISAGTKEGQTLTLRPGQQANVSTGSKIQLVENADMEQVMAWKNGLFQFKKADIQTVMRQLSCWYDVDVEYAGKIPDDKFGGDLPRDSNISIILKALEQAQVHFRLEEKKIIVLP
ncbi:MAG: FecR domain-containing protein [Chitinophagaceae bacterium]|nr:FecR domain-containing protein [Chitinophagaceae bacterium]